MAMEIFDSTFMKLQEGISKATKRQSVISQNIANLNNPDYQALEFNDVLNKAVKRVNSKVVLEEEMADLAKNSEQNAAYVKLLTAKLSALHFVVTQGKH
jgi:flagellar basal-body rod protein FlgB